MAYQESTNWGCRCGTGWEAILYQFSDTNPPICWYCTLCHCRFKSIPREAAKSLRRKPTQKNKSPLLGWAIAPHSNLYDIILSGDINLILSYPTTTYPHLMCVWTPYERLIVCLSAIHANEFYQIWKVVLKSLARFKKQLYTLNYMY